MRGLLQERLSPLIGAVRSFEPVFSWAAFLAGWMWDALTLQRIDAPATQWLLVGLWGVVILCLMLLAAVRGECAAAARLRRAAALGAQFAMGGLLSALSIFFVRSASWSAALVFVGGIVALLVANEFLRASYLRVVPLFALWMVGSSALALLVVPTVLGTMGDRTVLLALLGAAGIGLLIGWVVARLQKTSFAGYSALAIGIPSVVGALLAANLVPPVPLAAEEVGIYHRLWRDEEGYHLVAYEKRGLDRFLPPAYDTALALSDAPIYCFSAIVAPAGLHTTVFHRWQWKTEEGQWETHARVPIRLVGGREGGFRGYSFVRNLRKGTWRCRVEDGRGRVIGEARTVVRERQAPRGEVLWVR